MVTSVGRETWDSHDKLFVGEVVCTTCGAHFLYSRAATAPEPKRPRGKR